MAFKLGGKSGLPMKRSGFKMRKSPFQRNMGLGVSPVKNLGNFIDGERVTEEAYNEFLAKQKELEDKRIKTISSGGPTEEQYEEYGVEKPMSQEEWYVKNNPDYMINSTGDVVKKSEGEYGATVSLGGDPDYQNYVREQGEKVEDSMHQDIVDATYTTDGDGTERAQATGEDWFAQKRLEHEEAVKSGETDIYDFSKYLDEYHADDAYKQGLYSTTKEGKVDAETQKLMDEREEIIDADTEGETPMDAGNTYGEFDDLFKPGTRNAKKRS